MKHNTLAHIPGVQDVTVTPDGRTAELVYEPGNGTCYEVLIALVDLPGRSGSVNVALLNFGSSARFHGFPSAVSVDYLSSKLRIGHADAEALTRLLAAVGETCPTP